MRERSKTYGILNGLLSIVDDSLWRALRVSDNDGSSHGQRQETNENGSQRELHCDCIVYSVKENTGAILRMRIGIESTETGLKAFGLFICSRDGEAVPHTEY